MKALTPLSVIFGIGSYLLALGAVPISAEPARVSLIRTPDEGIQPQAAVDGQGGVHLIYFKGHPQGGDVFYVRRQSGESEFSSPLRVNSESGSAIAMGSIRGAQLAIGGSGRVHVAWMGGTGAARARTDG